MRRPSSTLIGTTVTGSGRLVADRRLLLSSVVHVQVNAEVTPQRRLGGKRRRAVRAVDAASRGHGGRRPVRRRHVRAELVVGEEASRAQLARERALAAVTASHVQRPVLGPHEARAALRARVRLVARVRAACVLPEVARLRERGAAAVARVRQLAAVQALMDLERRPAAEPRTALLADVRPRVGVARRVVVDQVMVAREAALADRADVRARARVQEPMVLHRRPGRQRLAAVGTRLRLAGRPSAAAGRPDDGLRRVHDAPVLVQYAGTRERLAARRAHVRPVRRVNAQVDAEAGLARERAVAVWTLVWTLAGVYDGVLT